MPYVDVLPTFKSNGRFLSMIGEKPRLLNDTLMIIL